MIWENKACTWHNISDLALRRLDAQPSLLVIKHLVYPRILLSTNVSSFVNVSVQTQDTPWSFNEPLCSYPSAPAKTHTMYGT